MNAIEALEAMKTGISVVAFRSGDTMAMEMMTLTMKDNIEMFLATTMSTKPTEVFTEKTFLAVYKTATFVGYNI